MSKKFTNILAMILCALAIGVLGYMAASSRTLGPNRIDRISKGNKGLVPITLTGIVVEKKNTELIIIAGDLEEVFQKNPKGQKVKLLTNEKTRYIESLVDKSGIPAQVEISSGNVKKNNLVSVSASIDSDGVFTAIKVVMVRKPNEPSRALSKSNGQGMISGTVASVKDKGFTVRAESGETRDVVTSSTTEFVIAFENKQPEKGSPNDLVINCKVSAMGRTLADGRLQADQVLLAE